MYTDVPDLTDNFPKAYTNMEHFKFVMFLTIFPLPYGSMTIKQSLSNNSISDALHNISGPGPIRSQLISNWSKPLVDETCTNPNAAPLRQALTKAQHWADNVLIQSERLADNKDKDWDAIKVITNAGNLLHAS